MRKSLTLLLMLALILATSPFVQAAGTAPGTNVLILYMNKANVTLNGVSYPAAQPTVNNAGTSYAPLSMLAARFGYPIRYDVATKESVVTTKTNELRWKAGADSYKLDGVETKMAGKSFLQNNSMMVPVRAWANVVGATLSVAVKGQISLTWTVMLPPTADFTVDTKDIYATQTQVVYTSHSANAQFIAAERWEGQEQVFAEAGPHTITRWVQSTTGDWSEPYSVTVNVLPPNQPPQALFTTDKTTYKIGEPIKYIDQSTDDENAITSTDWFNNKPAFFQSGSQLIELRVTDKHGETSSYTQTIVISDEVMNTEEQFNQHYTPLGEKYAIDGQAVLNNPTVPYTYTVSDSALIASDSPEDLTKPGILYRDSLSGTFRLFLYHQNISATPLTIYLAATNESADTATVSVGSTGIAGPNSFGLWTGKLASERYLESSRSGAVSQTTLAPGETKLMLTQLSAMPVKINQVLSAYADLNASSTVKFTLFAVASDGRAPLDVLPTLGNLTRDGKHIRGTFQGADREIKIDKVLGDQTERIVFGDHKNDPALDGRDMLNGIYENNWGNFGVRYHMTVRVKPNTLIVANARGGVYSGVFKINETSVMVSNSSLLQNPNQACVLYRTTGPYEEVVEISFLTALGSNLPVNLLFIPMNPN